MAVSRRYARPVHHWRQDPTLQLGATSRCQTPCGEGRERVVLFTGHRNAFISLL